MTDKQIVDVTQCPYYKEDKTCTYLPYKSKCEGDCNWTAYKEMEEQLKRKEQECEFSNLKIIQLQETLSQYETDLSIKDCIVETCKSQYKELKAENEELKDLNTRLDNQRETYWKGYQKLKQTLTEIKPILEFYANSTLGEEQEDGTYRIELSYKYGSSNMCGAPCYYKYNPKPARQALQKISEVEDG